MKRSSAVIGTQQSPIDIVTSETIHGAFAGGLQIDYVKRATIRGTFAGHNFVVDPSERATLTFRGDTYRLVKVHYHQDCEHTIDGVRTSDFELHLVHQREENGALATDKLVVGVFFRSVRAARSRPGVRAIGERGERLNLAELPLGDLVPDDVSRWYLYEGSLTSDPYSEDVTWIVLADPEAILADELAELRQHDTDQTARVVQPLNRRFVLRSFA